MRRQPGDLVSGKYRLIRLIGDGGMGSVFEARHEYLGTAVALKFLHPELAARPGLVARFLQEARLSASIKSHHIAHVTDVDQGEGGAAYLVMELLEGSSLQQILDREKVLPAQVALDYTLQILAGLERPTQRASFIAISNPTTCSSCRRRAALWSSCSTSASPSSVAPKNFKRRSPGRGS